MITFSRCPIVLYPLTFLSEENSRWTAAAPSQMPFPPPYAPPDRKPNRLKQGQKGCVALRASSSTTDFRSWLFDVPHYRAEKNVCYGHYFDSESVPLFRSKYYRRSISLVPSEGFLELHILRFATYNYA